MSRHCKPWYTLEWYVRANLHECCVRCITIAWMIGSSRIGKSVLKRGLWYTKRYVEYNVMLALSNVKLYERGLPIYLKVHERSPQGPFNMPKGTWKNPQGHLFILWCVWKILELPGMYPWQENDSVYVYRHWICVL